MLAHLRDIAFTSPLKLFKKKKPLPSGVQSTSDVAFHSISFLNNNNKKVSPSVWPQRRLNPNSTKQASRENQTTNHTTRRNTRHTQTQPEANTRPLFLKCAQKTLRLAVVPDHNKYYDTSVNDLITTKPKIPRWQRANSFASEWTSRMYTWRISTKRNYLTPEKITGQPNTGLR